MSIREEMLLELFARMAEHMDAGIDRHAALERAAEDMKQSLRAMMAHEIADVMREAGIIKVH